MSFGSKRLVSRRFRGTDGSQAGDSLFESDWNALIIRFDPESQNYRVITASPEQDDLTNATSNDEIHADIAKAAGRDV